MKKNKWLKWKVGAAASLGIALLFHEVRASDAFKQAVADMTSSGGQLSASAQQDQGATMDDTTWQSFFNTNDNSGSAGTADQNGGQASSQASSQISGQSSSQSSSQSNSQSNSQTNGQTSFFSPSAVSSGSAHTRTGRS
jgi:hypothetical protein